ncbi:MAG: DUF2892 domain-containing protein [Flavobacteriales bacterium]|jgi:hypothetical protein
MKHNLGKIDQTLRFILGTLMVLSTLLEWTQGRINTFLLILGSFFVITSGMRFCPLYKALGKSTTQAKND